MDGTTPDAPTARIMAPMTARSMHATRVEEVIYLLLCRHNRWPTWAEVDHELDQRLEADHPPFGPDHAPQDPAAPVPDPWTVVRAANPAHILGIGTGPRPSTTQTVALSVAGLAVCPNAHEDVSVYVASVAAAAAMARQAPPGQNAVVRSIDLPHVLKLPAAGRSDILARVGEIWRMNGPWEQFSPGTVTEGEPGAGDGGDGADAWQAIVGVARTRPFRNLTTVEQYLAAAARAADLDTLPPGEVVVGRSGDHHQWFPSRRVGHGGYGHVFEAVHANGDPLVIKWVSVAGETASERDINAKKARRELEVLDFLADRQLTHVMGMVDFAEHPLRGLGFLFPRAEHSLADALTTGPVTGADAWGLFEQLTAGVVELHTNNVVHRDIKPANVLLLDGRWVWGDVGLSRIAEVATATYTRSGYGTPHYCAPELFEGKAATESSDIYALACTLAEAVTGRRLFDGEDTETIIRTHIIGAPDLSDVSDPLLRRLLTWMLAKHPGARPATAERVLRDIRGRHDPQAGGERAQRLRDLGARFVARENAAAALVGERAALQARREQARAALQGLWLEVEAAADRWGHGAVADVDSDPWWVDTVGRRLRLLLAEPPGGPGERGLLWLGELGVCEDQSSNRVDVANVVCFDGRLPQWRLFRMQQTDVGADRLHVSRSRADGRGAIGINELEDYLNNPVRGFQPVIAEESALTSDAILDLFLDEVDAIEHEQP